MRVYSEEGFLQQVLLLNVIMYNDCFNKSILLKLFPIVTFNVCVNFYGSVLFYKRNIVHAGVSISCPMCLVILFSIFV